jgi:hypothetical protein
VTASKVMPSSPAGMLAIEAAAIGLAKNELPNEPPRPELGQAYVPHSEDSRL